MKYSVVIPAYNRADLLEQAIQSVLAQTCQDFEIIVVDDGSSEPICPCVADPRLRVIRHPLNRGASAARNTGIANAQGELIALLDSDDLWLPEKLQKQAEFMEDRSYGASLTSYEFDTPEGYFLMHLQKPKSWLRELSMGCTQGPGTTLVVRRECYAVVGLYDETMVHHEDYDWLLRFVQKFDLGVLKTPLARVRLSNNPAGDIIRVANQTILERYGKLFLELGWFSGTRAIGRRHLETGVFYSLEKNKPMASKYLWYALRANPLQHPGMVYRVVEAMFSLSLYPKIKKTWTALRAQIPGRRLP